MFEEPDEDREELAFDPAARAKEKSDEFRLHAELAAVYEGSKKFEAEIDTDFDLALAREIQRTVAKLERARETDTPIILGEPAKEAAALLDLPATRDLSTNDYYVAARPGEVLMVRWLAGDEVETFYERLQAHFDAALGGFVEDEEQAHAWKRDAKALAYLAGLKAINVKMQDRYLRSTLRDHHLAVLSTQTADEINIAYLCDFIMGVPAAEIVGEESAPPDNPRDSDLAWYFKLFALRGVRGEVEQMCFFTYLQKADG